MIGKSACLNTAKNSKKNYMTNFEQPVSNSSSDLEKNKRDQLEKLCEGVPDAIYILNAVTKTENGYKVGSYADADWKGFLSGGKPKALAGLELAEQFPDATVAVNSMTFKISDQEAPTDAQVMADYLEQQGLSSERVVMQTNSQNTFEELVELIKSIQKYGWQHVAVVATETQKPRTIEMLRQIETLVDPRGASKEPVFREALEYLKDHTPKITVVSSEDILPIRSSAYKAVIEKARETDLWKTRQALDEQALRQLREGTYWK